MAAWKIGVGVLLGGAVAGGLYYLFRPATAGERDDLARRSLDTSPQALQLLTAAAPLQLNLTIASPAT